MKRNITIFLFILGHSILAQSPWTYQLSLGKSLGMGDVKSQVVLADTLVYSFHKKGLNFTSAAFMASYQINDKWMVRTGVDGVKTVVDVNVENRRNTTEDYFERRGVADLHVPVEMQYIAANWLYLNFGLSANIRLEFDREAAMAYDVSDLPEHEKVAFDAMRPVTLNYRFGVTMRKDWFGLDIMYDRPMQNLIYSPLNYHGNKGDVKFRFSIVAIRAVYFFKWEKLKETLNK
jgi:hypothetical protein